jgi:hypothetical protein
MIFKNSVSASAHLLIVRLVAVALACLVAGCSSWRHWQMERTAEAQRAAALARVDKQECISQGGRIDYVGMLGVPACVKSYADADQPCTDTTQCHGLCLAADKDPVGSTPATGHCEKNDHDHFGCYNTVQQGVVVAGLCVD